MIWRGARLLPTSGDSSWTTAEAESVTTTSVVAEATSNLKSWRTAAWASTANTRVSMGEDLVGHEAVSCGAREGHSTA